MAVGVPLFWNENLEPNIAGYKIYVGRATHDYTVPGSPVSVGNVLEYVYTITADEGWYFVITALTTSAEESFFSSEVFYFLTPTMPVMSFMGGSGDLPVNYPELGTVDKQTQFYAEGAVVRHPAGVWYQRIGGNWTAIADPTMGAAR